MTKLTSLRRTTADIKFVHTKFFPYSADHMESHVHDHQNHPIVQKQILETKKTILGRKQNDDLNGVLSLL
jgi:methionine salvage enolase-phosphatase E1